MAMYVKFTDQAVSMACGRLSRVKFVIGSSVNGNVLGTKHNYTNHRKLCTLRQKEQVNTSIHEIICDEAWCEQ